VNVAFDDTCVLCSGVAIACVRACGACFHIAVGGPDEPCVGKRRPFRNPCTWVHSILAYATGSVTAVCE